VSDRNQQSRDNLRTPAGGQASWLEVGNTLDACHMTESSPPAETIAKSRPTMAPNRVSTDDASKEVTTPTDTAAARPRAGPGLHPETSSGKVITSKWNPQQGERLPRAPLPIHQIESGKGFRPEPRTPLPPFAVGSQHYSCSHFRRGDVPGAALHCPPL
jgi:hypothetical protein